MPVHNVSHISFDGEPVVLRSPAPIVVLGGQGTGYQISPRQHAEIRRHYHNFVNGIKLSLLRHHEYQRQLSDGSQMRITSIQGKEKIYFTPVDSGDDTCPPVEMDSGVVDLVAFSSEASQRFSHGHM